MYVGFLRILSAMDTKTEEKFRASLTPAAFLDLFFDSCHLTHWCFVNSHKLYPLFGIHLMIRLTTEGVRGSEASLRVLRAAVNWRETKRLKFEINLKSGSWCRLYRVISRPCLSLLPVSSDIYRSRFQPISAVLLTLTPALTDF